MLDGKNMTFILIEEDEEAAVINENASKRTSRTKDKVFRIVKVLSILFHIKSNNNNNNSNDVVTWACIFL